MEKVAVKTQLILIDDWKKNTWETGGGGEMISWNKIGHMLMITEAEKKGCGFFFLIIK